jgi:hypothetical protein
MIPALCRDWSSDLHLHGGPLDPETQDDPPICPECGEEHAENERCPEKRNHARH